MKKEQEINKFNEQRNQDLLEKQKQKLFYQ